MIRNFVCFCGLMILLSCQTRSKEPPGILKPDKMQAVLWDVIRADAFTKEFIKRDSAKNDVEENLKLQREIFAIHHVSKEEFYKSFGYYKKNSSLMKGLIDTMVNRAERNSRNKIKPVQAQ